MAQGRALPPSPRCNLNVKARWNVGKWHAPGFAGAVRYRPAFPMPALGPKRLRSHRRGLGVPVCGPAFLIIDAFSDTDA